MHRNLYKQRKRVKGESLFRQKNFMTPANQFTLDKNVLKTPQLKGVNSRGGVYSFNISPLLAVIKYVKIDQKVRNLMY